MIIAQMMGNLGNQLFIYGMARALQLDYGDDIVFDLTGLKRFYYSSAYKLNALNLPLKGISYSLDNVPSSVLRRYRLSSKLYHIEQKLYRKLRDDKLVPDSVTKKWFDRGYYYNFSRNYYDYPPCNQEYKFVYGYFQNLDYFRKYEDTIKAECRVRINMDDYDRLMLPKIQESNAVAVSIRAINEKGVSFIDYDYYYRAMDYIAKRVEHPVFYVFSDDIETTKSLPFPYSVEYVTPSDSCHGLRLLYSCRHFIIANSTFSWWGAFMGQSQDSIVIMPEYIDKHKIGRDGYYLDNAIKLPCSFVDYKWDLDQIVHQKYAK